MVGSHTYAKELAKYGLRRGVYAGARKRRFCLFEQAEHNGERVEIRREFDTRREREAATATALRRLMLCSP
jgi:hypothetical protein